MGITVQCTCGKELRARDSYGGKSAPCPRCGRTLLIPAQLPEVAWPAMSRMAPDEAEPDRAATVAAACGPKRTRPSYWCVFMGEPGLRYYRQEGTLSTDLQEF